MMHRFYVDTPCGQIHARTAGSGPEMVLLLHQTAASSAMYEAFAAKFLEAGHGERYTLVAADTPGFGMSYVPHEQYALERWADDMAAVLDALGAQRAHVLGHHTGAAIAATMAARHPDRIVSLAMVGATAMTLQDRTRWHVGVTAMTPTMDGAHLLTAWEQVGTIDADLAYAPDLVLRHREVVDKLRAGVRWHEAYLAVFSTDVGALLEKVTAAALLLCGTSDVLYPYVPETVCAIPHARFVALEGGGYILDQDPAAILEHYIGFLTDISEEVECPPVP
ncbi:alpha/beta fold hydrolase [Rhodococcus rhodochrous]|uniref:Alpha/beta hydrolase n=1 Tax=Rhodococcus rhodochrous TaxID=1829 RepID=A0AA46WYB0_RHORH|nr:alpha/beta hydrolase [Rhodococcus rhodochrous]UZF46650.1 alpha/beta hydrolase [Rhodococcus rhodochrous]